MLSDSDVTAELHMHDSMVWHYPLSKQSQILCIICQLCQFSKADKIPISILFQANKCFLFQVMIFLAES